VKIICVDNFDRERPGLSDDVLIAECVSERYVETIVGALNAKYSPNPNDEHHFKAVPDNYELRKYVP
jgi:hypothetical protein